MEWIDLVREEAKADRQGCAVKTRAHNAELRCVNLTVCDLHLALCPVRLSQPFFSEVTDGSK